MSSVRIIRVLLADNHEILRRSLINALAIFEDIKLVGEADNGLEAVRLCAVLEPDVAVMALRLPGLDGVSATRLIREQFPQTRVVILTSSLLEEDVTGALQAGAVAYLRKDVSIDGIVRAIREAIDVPV